MVGWSHSTMQGLEAATLCLDPHRQNNEHSSRSAHVARPTMPFLLPPSDLTPFISILYHTVIPRTGFCAQLFWSLLLCA